VITPSLPSHWEESIFVMRGLSNVCNIQTEWSGFRVDIANLSWIWTGNSDFILEIKWRNSTFKNPGIRQLKKSPSCPLFTDSQYSSGLIPLRSNRSRFSLSGLYWPVIWKGSGLLAETSLSREARGRYTSHLVGDGCYPVVIHLEDGLLWSYKRVG